MLLERLGASLDVVAYDLLLLLLLPDCLCLLIGLDKLISAPLPACELDLLFANALDRLGITDLEVSLLLGNAELPQLAHDQGLVLTALLFLEMSVPVLALFDSQLSLDIVELRDATKDSVFTLDLVAV